MKSIKKYVLGLLTTLFLAVGFFSQAADEAEEALEDISQLQQVATSPKETGAKESKITNLEFKSGEGKARIVVTGSGELQYEETRNATMKQLIYVFKETRVEPRLERAFDTTEFSSPVALFTLMQVPKAIPQAAKLIIQMRENVSATVVRSGTGLTIEFPVIAMAQKTADPEEREETQTEMNIYASDQVYSGKPIRRLEIKNSDIHDVLRLIAKSSGYNIVIGDDVSGKVGTFSVENIPWDQAFALVLQSKKLGYIKQGNVLRVATLSTLKSEKEEAIANEASKIRVEPLKTVIIPVSYAKSTELATRAKAFLSERGSAESDVRSNAIIVRDVEKNVQRIQRLFSVLDTQPPKVSVSAKFVEMSQTFSRDIGFYSHLFRTNLAGVSIDQSFLNSTVSGRSTTVIRAPNLGQLESTLKLGETEEKVKVLANPSLTINSNQKGSVQQGVSYTYVTQENQNGVLTNVFRNVTANLALEVTPIVAGDGSITMDVKIQNEIPSGNPPEPLTINTRKVETNVLVENGDTIVIGGVFQDTVKDNLEGTPFLMRIPILGYLFSGTRKFTQRSEILVFLTPKIMNMDEAFKRTF